MAPDGHAGFLARVPVSVPEALEIAAALVGIVSVWLAAREHVVSWPLGLLNVLAYAVIYWTARLYANAGLQVAYVVLNGLGWWRWRHGGAVALSVTRTPLREVPGLVGAVVALTVGLHTLLASAGGASPWLDAALTAGSLVAQWQLTRKRADTWGWWIVINIGYLAMLSEQGLWASVVQYAVFLLIAIDGHRRWWRDTRTALAP